MIPRKSLTATRFTAAGTYDSEGKYIEGADGTINFTASVQPATTREMELLPEGRRTKSMFKLYSDTKLLTATEDGGTNADIVDIEGEEYEVLSVASWQNRVRSHYKIIIGLRG